jgi:Ca-activated chloride channel homolog
LLKVRISTACLLVLAEVSLSVPSGAEWRTRRAESMLRVEKSLVLIPVSATDIDGRFVAGLRSEDFDVREDGNAQRIVSASTEDGPISLCIIFDVSTSMSKALPYAREAVRKLLAHSAQEDEFVLVIVQSEPTVAVDWTSDPEAVLWSTEHTLPDGDTALFDALMLGMVKFRHAAHRRRTTLMITDGADNNSRYTRSEVLRFLREADVAVYSIHMTDWSAESWETAEALKDFARDSGGRYFHAKTTADFSRIAESLDVRRHYLLAYTPNQAPSDGGIDASRCVYDH